MVEFDGGPFKFSQIKKYGTLRVCWDGAVSPTTDARIEEAISLAEARAVTCEVAARPAAADGGDWMTTCCEAHAEGLQAVVVRWASKTFTW